MAIEFRRVKPFRFWCQKVLPAVYDDSLSYYELLCKVIDYLNTVIETTNTQTDAIIELQEKLEEFMNMDFSEYFEEKVDEWFQEHENQIWVELQEVEEQVELNTKELTKLEARSITSPNFAIQSRIAIESSTLNGRALQSGCVFSINNRVYCAEWFATDDDETNDILYIVDLNANQIVGNVSMQIGHGQNPTFNPNTNELAVCGNDQIFYIDVSAPTTPFVSRSVATPDIGEYGKPAYIAWDDKTYQYFYVLKNNLDNTGMVLLKTPVDFSRIIETIDLNITDYGNYIWQSIDVKNGILYFANSAPECVIMCDVNTGERLNVIKIPDFINFLNVGEVEWAGVIDNTLYIAQANNYPNYVVPVVFAWNMKTGTVPRKEKWIVEYSEPQLNQMRYIRVAWNNANLLDPWNPIGITPSGAVPHFKFVEDAINYCKHLNITPRLSFVGDYKNYAVIESMTLSLNPETAVTIGGLCFNNCDVMIVNANRLTVNGVGSSVIHSNTYMHAMRFETCRISCQSSSLWTVNNELYPNLTPSEGYFARSIIFGYSITEWNVAAFTGCVVHARSTAHSSVVNLEGTTWLNG